MSTCRTLGPSLIDPGFNVRSSLQSGSGCCRTIRRLHFSKLSILQVCPQHLRTTINDVVFAYLFMFPKRRRRSKRKLMSARVSHSALSYREFDRHRPRGNVIKATVDSFCAAALQATTLIVYGRGWARLPIDIGYSGRAVQLQHVR